MSSTSDGEAALILRGVTRSFQRNGHDQQALKDVDITVRHRRVTGLIGPDGAGKTTLMRLAAGLLPPDSGTLRTLDIDTRAAPLAVQSSIGYMPQRFGLYEDLSVQENLDLYADLQGVPVASRPDRYTALLRMTGLAPFTGRLAGRLSGGMKQKLGLACTLIRPPRLLLLDEPTVGVDPVSRRELWRIIYQLVREEGMSVLLSTAYLDEAERCDEVILLHQGRVLQQGTPETFSAPMRGRTFRVAAGGAGKRRLQAWLDNAPGILDALIEGDHIRLVTERPGMPELAGPTPDAPALEIRETPPRFEDAFIAKLKQRREKSPLPERPLPHAAPATTAADDEVIRIRGAQRRFGDFYAVRDVSFSVRRGEVFGLLGANGAGKSTTFRMLCGLLPASAGELTVAGHDLRHAAARARSRIGYMAQRFSLYGSLTVQQNLHFFASAYGLRGEARRKRIRWALETFELDGYAHSNSGDLPLGFKQRLSFAAALMHEPEILFLDEPTSGVDPLARRAFWQRTSALAENGVTVLVTTHFMDEANYCDRLVIMADGEVLATGAPEALRAALRSPQHPEPTLEEAFIALIEGRESRQ